MVGLFRGPTSAESASWHRFQVNAIGDEAMPVKAK
jgi:hypothetical protein